MRSTFLDKLIERIGRVGPEEVQNYLLRVTREKGFFETIFNAIQEDLIVTDAEGRVSYVNQSACALFGIEREHAVGRKLSECVPGLDWDSLVRSENIMSRDMEVFYPQNRFLNFYAVPLNLQEAGRARQKPRPDRAKEELVGYAVILRDITESRRTTEETIESERLQALTLLAAGVAHEIGNPLNSLHIHLQLMERKVRKLPDDARGDLQKTIRIAREEIQRLDYIVTQFLRAIRPAPLETQKENLNTILEDSVAVLEAELDDREILVETELRPDLPLLDADRNQLKQAFYNIIKNAVQAMRSGGILRIRSGMDDAHLVVSFTDTGGGIPAEKMAKIFEPYFTTKSSGSGLGLMIVRRIVRDHGGEIDIMSDEGKGVTFTVRLPFRDKRVRLLPAGDLSRQSGAEGAAREEPAS